MVSIEAFSELLQVLYSAPLQQGQWKRFLTLVCQHTHFTCGFFISANLRHGPQILAEGGPQDSPLVIRNYNEQYAGEDPFRVGAIQRARTKSPVGVFSEDELVSSEQLFASGFYHGLMAPNNLRYGAINLINMSLREIDSISLWRSEELGPLESESRHLLNLLLPHVRSALEVRRVLGVKDRRLASAEAMANASPTPTFVLTRQGRVEHWNTAAESLVRGEDGLIVENGLLTARNSRSNAALSRLLHDAASLESCTVKSQPSRYHSFPRPSGKRPLQLIATPLPQAHRQRCHADLLLLVSDPEKPSNFPDDALRALYDLTPAETEIANGLLLGYSPEEISCLRRVVSTTVRYQIKSMLHKTGTSRQSDMVRLFMTLPQLPVQTT